MTVRHTNEIICREKWKKLRFLKNEAQNEDRIFWQNLIFSKSFFEKPLETFLLTLRACSRYLKSLQRLYLCACPVKKSWPYDTPIRLYVGKSEKSWDFWKMKLKMGIEYSDKTSYFQYPSSLCCKKILGGLQIKIRD